MATMVKNNEQLYWIWLTQTKGIGPVKQHQLLRLYSKPSQIFEALKERGYNPVNQIVGYLISGDPGYISNYKDSREKLMDFDRAEIVAIILEEYLDKE